MSQLNTHLQSDYEDNSGLKTALIQVKKKTLVPKGLFRTLQSLQSLLMGFSLRLFGQTANGQVVHHLLDFLHVVFEAVIAFPQWVVF